MSTFFSSPLSHCRQGSQYQPYPSHALSSGSSAPLSVWSTLLCCPWEVEGPFSLVLQLVRGWIRSPTCCRCWKLRGGGHLSHTMLPTTWQTTQPGQARSWSCEQDQVRYTVKSSASSPECFSWRESVPVLYSVVSEVWGRLCTALSRIWDINTDCFRSMNLSMGHYSSLGSDMIIKPTTSGNSSLFLFLNMSLSPGNELFCLSLFLPYHTLYLLIITVPHLPVNLWCWTGPAPCFLFKAQGRSLCGFFITLGRNLLLPLRWGVIPQACFWVSWPHSVCNGAGCVPSSSDLAGSGEQPQLWPRSLNLGQEEIQSCVTWHY